MADRLRRSLPRLRQPRPHGQLPVRGPGRRQRSHPARPQPTPHRQDDPFVRRTRARGWRTRSHFRAGSHRPHLRCRAGPRRRWCSTERHRRAHPRERHTARAGAQPRCRRRGEHQAGRSSLSRAHRGLGRPCVAATRHGAGTASARARSRCRRPSTPTGVAAQPGRLDRREAEPPGDHCARESTQQRQGPGPSGGFRRRPRAASCPRRGWRGDGRVDRCDPRHRRARHGTRQSARRQPTLGRPLGPR